ncbi:MAG: intradiol ring-cleavage dioxygenase [Planctomycetaceae bacterium]|nr:intradiol ring-cleavage dioxygenase [Planctomycetales bacterium]MCB9921252.1 intradiol ring-cleavage dioxygenase [Planctomycetaceae bacterium]
MTDRRFVTNRRRFVGALSASYFLTPGLFAEDLLLTPRLTEGPFYPDKLPLDKDNDLIVINDSTTPAVGEITHLSGKILDAGGRPIKDATIEIWQCDANAVYLHTADSVPKAAQRDKNFQGFGHFTTGSAGEYRFRTIKPVPYPGRPAPHIHFMIKKGGRELLTSQIFIAGHQNNARDGVFRGLRDIVDAELVQAEFKPIKESNPGEFAANFDIVLGQTPDDRALPSRVGSNS